jgi:hypothetical protein
MGICENSWCKEEKRERGKMGKKQDFILLISHYSSFPSFTHNSSNVHIDIAPVKIRG